MGIFNAIFGNKKDLYQIFIECRGDILKKYSLNTPTDVQLFNTTISLAIASVGMLNSMGRGQYRDLIDKLSDIASSEAQNLSFKIEDIASNHEEISFIISQFPPFANATKEMTTNGGAIFPIIYNEKGPKLVTEIIEHADGPMGPSGYAAIVIGDMVVGREKSKSEFMNVSMILTRYLKNIVSI